jgi:hypothetical protein
MARNCGPPPPLCGYGETAFTVKESSLLGTSAAKRPTSPKLARSASEGWLGVRDDFRNWLIRAA